MRAFFGLSSDYMEKIYEQFFYLKSVANWSMVELYNLPIGLREWFVKRTIKQKEAEKEEMEKSIRKRSGSPHSTMPINHRPY